MQGTLILHTPASNQVTTLNLNSCNNYEVARKTAELKERAQLQPGEGYIVFLQIPSKMNLPGFLLEDDDEQHF